MTVGRLSGPTAAVCPWRWHWRWPCLTAKSLHQQQSWLVCWQVRAVPGDDPDGEEGLPLPVPPALLRRVPQVRRRGGHGQVHPLPHSLPLLVHAKGHPAPGPPRQGVPAPLLLPEQACISPSLAILIEAVRASGQSLTAETVSLGESV